VKWQFRKKDPSGPPEGARARNVGDDPDFIIPWDAINSEYTQQLDRGVGEALTLVSSVQEIPNGLPEGWDAFLDPTPEIRIAAALEMWDPILEHMPLTKQLFKMRMLDVRLIRSGLREPALAYSILTNETNEILVFVGHDPRSREADPTLWGAVPAPLRNFIENCHSGVMCARLPYTAFPLFKSDMETLDSLEWGVVDTDEYSASGFDVPLDQILMVHESGGGASVCISPRMAGKGILWRSDAPPIVEEFWTLYDVSVLAICA
jgi:hypothetical protein